MEAEDRAELRAAGLDPDAPRVAAAIDLVRWELSLLWADLCGGDGV